MDSVSEDGLTGTKAVLCWKNMDDGICGLPWCVSRNRTASHWWPRHGNAHFPHNLLLLLLQLQLGLLDSVLLSAVIVPTDHALDLAGG